jgi:tetratricopeptide (TPR) repeat protein
MLYGGQGRVEEAKAALRGTSGDALDPLVAASGIVVNIFSGDFAAAIECAQQVVDLHPFYQLARIFHANALEHSGRLEDALAEYRRAVAMSPDLPWVRLMEATCMAKMGRRREVDAILREVQLLRDTQYIDAFHMAVLYEAMEKHNDAFTELERAADENSAMLFVIDIDPRTIPFRNDPRYARLRAKIYPAEKAPGIRTS